MKVIVTGGAGFIGSALVQHLVGQGTHVVVVDCFTYAANPASLEPLRDCKDLRIIRQDIRDARAVAELVAAETPDAIIHLAAESHVDRSIAGSAPFIETNIQGTWALLEASRALLTTLDKGHAEKFRFLQVSTDEVFGSTIDGYFSESTPYSPSSPYSASKAASDHLAMAWYRTYGLPVLLTNCSNNYGPRQHPEKLIPMAILNSLQGRQVPVYGDGQYVRDWIHVEDHARALDAILKFGRIGQQYLVGARAEMKNIDLVSKICDYVDEIASPLSRPRRELLAYVRDRLGHDRRYAIDPTKVERETRWLPTIPLETGIKRTVEWYLTNNDWWRAAQQSKR